MKNKISKILILIALCTGTYAYAAMQGDVVINAVDPSNSLKFTRVVGEPATGIRTTVMNADTNPVPVTQLTATSLNATVSQSTASSLNATVVQATGSNLKTEVSQPTAASLNATVVNALASTITNSQIVITNTATLIKTSNTSRKSIMIRNLSATDVYVGSNTVTIDTGLIIKVGDTYPLVLDKTSAAIYGIVSAGTATVSYIEQ